MTEKKPTTQYTITAAHRITGRSRTTIQKHLKQGKLSCVKGADGIKRIDASELIRVYGDSCDFSREEGGDTPSARPEKVASALVQSELNNVRQQLDTLQAERRRERDQLVGQIEHLQGALALAQEGHNRATFLLVGRQEQRENYDSQMPFREQSNWRDAKWWELLLQNRRRGSGSLS